MKAVNTVYALIVVLNPPAWGGQPFLSYEADYPTFAECETARDAEIKGWVDHPRITGLVRFGAECILVTPK
ncbi:MAG: hypothetical protein ACR2M4_09065 [Actinomycetota bacterium]